MKYYLFTEIQPQTVKELIKGLKDSWKNEMDMAYCNVEINHINNVITKLISLLGKPWVFNFFIPDYLSFNRNNRLIL